MPKRDLDSCAERAIRDMRKKEYKDTERAVALIREGAAEEFPHGDVTIRGEDLHINFKMLLRLLGVGVILAILSIAYKQANATPTTEKRDASYKCQRAAIPRNGGLVLPAATCVCNAKAGLPEYPSCRAQRAQKGGR